jgi:hypothetical protein
MIEFAHILAEIESLIDKPRDSGRISGVSFAPRDLDRFHRGGDRGFEAVDNRLGRAAQAYDGSDVRDQTPRTNSSRRRVNSEVRDMLAALGDASLSMSDLRSLRRRLAWMRHPDRPGLATDQIMSPTMSEINAWIDAAIAKRARGLRERRSK